jgi:glycogen operon protein
MEFTRKLVKLRLTHPNLHRRKFFQDRTIRNSVVRDIAWYGADGHEMTESEWTTEWTRSMGVMLNGKTLQASNEEGDPLEDDSFLILVNAFHEGVEFTLPPVPNGSPWRHIMDTENIVDPFKSTEVGEKVIVGGRSMMVFSDGASEAPPASDTKRAQTKKSRKPRAASSSQPS